MKTVVDVNPGVQVELQKIMFVTFLKIFYQNIKHRDGLAEKFEPINLNPPLKKYRITINNLKLNLYEFKKSQGRESSKSKMQTKRKSRISRINAAEFKEV